MLSIIMKQTQWNLEVELCVIISNIIRAIQKLSVSRFLRLGNSILLFRTRSVQVH